MGKGTTRVLSEERPIVAFLPWRPAPRQGCSLLSKVLARFRTGSVGGCESSPFVLIFQNSRQSRRPACAPLPGLSAPCPSWTELGVASEVTRPFVGRVRHRPFARIAFPGNTDYPRAFPPRRVCRSAAGTWVDSFCSSLPFSVLVCPSLYCLPAQGPGGALRRISSKENLQEGEDELGFCSRVGLSHLTRI